MAMESNGVRDIIKLFTADFLELFSLGRELFINLDHLLSHDLMGLLRATDQDKIGAAGQAFMAIGIQSDTQHHGFAPAFRLARFRH